MRVGILYGVLTAGGCERRLGELARTLLDGGDDVYVLAARMDDIGVTTVVGQCGVPLQRLLEVCHLDYAPDVHQGQQ